LRRVGLESRLAMPLLSTAEPLLRRPNVIDGQSFGCNPALLVVPCAGALGEAKCRSAVRCGGGSPVARDLLVIFQWKAARVSSL